jgi:hypothetical protein
LLNTSYDHGCYLANRFRLQPEEYEALLIVSGLASITRFGFQVKPTAWKKFLGGHQLAGDDCVIEFEQKTINLNAYINGTPPSRLHRRKIYIVRIGKTLEESPRKIKDQIGWDGRLLIAPPRLNLLRITQQSFRRIVDQYLWEYSIENDDVDDIDSGSDGGSPLLCSPPQKHPQQTTRW